VAHRFLPVDFKWRPPTFVSEICHLQNPRRAKPLGEFEEHAPLNQVAIITVNQISHGTSAIIAVCAAGRILIRSHRRGRVPISAAPLSSRGSRVPATVPANRARPTLIPPSKTGPSAISDAPF
jgi:hypothetical protein